MSIKGKYLAAGKKDEVFEVKDALNEIATGGKPGIESKVFSKQDMDGLKSDMKEKEQKAEKQRSPFTIASAALAFAAYRNAEYIQSGRKFMRLSGLSGRAKAMLGKGSILAYCEEAEKNSK